jgi:prepilin-type N-terminal cleavage/methylation domain-containing protein/prepilin-type processing-associated H-X9-DG protein
MRRTIRSGFTLVELLVVIGIIALLVSILLPALNRARQAANAVDCAARMRTIGQALHMYASAFKGGLPSSNTWSRHNNGFRNKFIQNTLSERLGTQEFHLHKVFHDVDTMDIDPGVQPFQNPYSGLVDVPWTNHYSANCRLFPVTNNKMASPPGAPGVGERYPLFSFAESVDSPDGWNAKISAYRSLADVKNHSEVAAFWDAHQVAWGGGTGRRWWPAWYTSDATDMSGWHNINNRFVSIGNVNTANYRDRKVLTTNKDGWGLGQQDAQGGIRFRHMKNKQANILYLDGHVGSHTLNPATGVTTMSIRELGCNFKKGDYK